MTWRDWANRQTSIDPFFFQRVWLAFAVGVIIGLLVSISVRVGVW